MECLVGDLTVDEDPEEEVIPVIEKLEDDVWKIRGEATVDEIEKELEINIPEGEFDTFNGMVLSQLDEIPEEGSEFEVVFENLTINVNSVLNHQVETAVVRVNRPEPAEETADEE